MYDLLDMLQPHPSYTMTGSFYPERPTAPEDGAAYFDYEPVDVTQWRYQKLLGNLLNTDGASTTIRTNDDMGWKVDNYVVLQDNRVYRVESVSKDYQSASKQVFRFLKDAPQTDYVLRLLEQDNPWGIE